MSRNCFPSQLVWAVLTASILEASSASLHAAVVLDDPLQGSTSGTRVGGQFVPGGWQVTNKSDTIYWHVPTLAKGAAEFEVLGLQPIERRAGMEDKTELFHMYDHTVGDADRNYNGGYRDNPFKHFIRKIGALDRAKVDALELVWQIQPKYLEPDTAVLPWESNRWYRFREEWGPDGAGNSVLRTYRDGALLRTTPVAGNWAPVGHSIRIAASPRRADDAGAPLGAIFRNVKVWDNLSTNPITTKITPPAGVVRLRGHSLEDDRGPFLGLGVSYFQALRRAKFDRARLQSDLAFLAAQRFNYVRVLSMVGGNEAWQGLEIAPVSFKNRRGVAVAAWPDYWQQFRDLIDLVHSNGMRAQVTIFADAQLMPGKAERLAHLDAVLKNLTGREHKVILLEVANEAWQNGFPGTQGVADLREFTQYLAARTAIPVAITSNDDPSDAGITALYRGSAADIATVHFSRDISTAERGWLPVHDCYRAGRLPGVPPASSNEPIGPGASVASENDPIKLVMAAAFAWGANLPMYVFHSNAGVFGKTPFQTAAGVSNYVHLLDILPPDFSNWRRNDGKEASAPFTAYANGQANRWWLEVANPASGVVRNTGASKGAEFITLPIGVLQGGLTLEARRPLRLRVYHPLTGAVVDQRNLKAGERFTVAQGPGAYIIKGVFLVEATILPPPSPETGQRGHPAPQSPRTPPRPPDAG